MSYIAPGTVLGRRYEVGRELGRGGSSVVYLGRDRRLGQEVALKLLVPPPAAAEAARERMRREVLAVRELAHQHIVQVHDFLDEGPWSFIVMEYVRGPTLAERVRDRGPLAAEEAAALGRAVAAALSAAHRRGILHRDVKPQNVLLGPDGRARLTDFGSARLEGQATLTTTGGLVGTIDYLAPEVLHGNRGDARGDVYALGMTLYFALTGRLPDRPSPHLPPPAEYDGHRPSHWRPGLPAWLDDAVAAATSALPADRFPSAALFAEALEQHGPPPVRAAATGLAFCLLCGGDEPLGLGLCPACAAGQPPATEATVLLVRPETPAEDLHTRKRLRELLGPRPSPAELAETARGRRSLVRVPHAAVERVLERLAQHGIVARAVTRNWLPLPSAIYAIAAAMAISGMVAGAVALSYLLWASPLLAALMVLEAQRRTRRPLVTAHQGGSPLPPPVRHRLAETVARLPSGSALSLLADLARSAQAIYRRVGAHPGLESARSELEELLRCACGTALDLAELEESLSRLERIRASGSTPPAGWGEAVTGAERARDKLVQRMLDTATALGQLRVRSLDLASDGGELGVELAMLTDDLRQEVESYAAALREVEAAVARS